MRKLAAICLIATTPLLGACDTVDSHTARNAQVELVGMSRPDFYACAGLPNRTQTGLDGLDYETWDYQPYVPDSNLSASLPLVGSISLGGSGTCHATAIFQNGKIAAINYAGDTGSILGHVAECVSIVDHCLDGAKEATGKY